MSNRCIFVLIDGSARATMRVELATRLASRWECDLVGLYVMYATEPTRFHLAQGAGQYVAEDRAWREALRDNARETFLAVVNSAQIEAEWRSTQDEPTTATLREVREADLIIAGQAGAGKDIDVAPQYLESIILGSGRPVLAVPSVGTFDMVGHRALVAWNGAREAARALHDAAPLIAGGRALVLNGHPGAAALHADATPVAGACRILGRYGVATEVEDLPQGPDSTIGESLLSRAADFSADLIVAGGYGHSRLRELTVGGVTRTLLGAMTVPVLFSH